jgi:micrococcal nuclease
MLQIVNPMFTCKPLSICLLLILSFGAGLVSGDAQSTEWHVVRWVIDGDTIVLKDGRRVRFIGINAPEIAHEQRKAEPLANKARALNIHLVARKKVRLAYDQEREDDYGRLLAYVFLKDGTLLNHTLIAKGLAHCYTFYPNIRYKERLLKAQRKAMQDQKGIWRLWKATPSQRLIGNRRSGRFYPQSCRHQKKIHPQAILFFNHAWDAFWEGLAPERRCLSYLKHP